MSKVNLHDNRFYLSRKLVLVVTLFLVTASGLVVLTNFAVNLMAATRDYTYLVSNWSLQYDNAGRALEAFAYSGDKELYSNYLQHHREQLLLSRPIRELFQPDTDASVVYKSLRVDSLNPAEISTLIATFHRFDGHQLIDRVQRRWQHLTVLDRQRTNQAKILKRAWRQDPPNSDRIKASIEKLQHLNRQWNDQTKALMHHISTASLSIKRIGLWISVILGVLLVLTGVIVTVRANKSVSRWEHILYEKEVLLSEIHHRVKNNLAVVSSLLQMESMQPRDPEQALQESRDRIKSMAMIHELLYQSNTFSAIRFDHYIGKLSSYIFNTYSPDGKEIDFQSQLEEVLLNINQAVPAALILNELLTNAMEHGFKNRKSGLIKVIMSVQNEEVILHIMDNGSGLPEAISYERADTSGFTIIHALVKQLDGELKVHTDQGVKALLKFNISNRSGSSNGHL